MAFVVIYFLQMHLLLFQVIEDGNMPYYPLKFSYGISSSLSLFSGTQSQLNMSLLKTSQQQSHIDCSNKRLKFKESTLRTGGIDFHPFVQKSNDTKSHTSFDAIQTEQLGNVDEPPIASGSFEINDKSNELDLKFHLNDKSNELDLNVTASTCGLAQSVLPLVVPNDNIARNADAIGYQSSHPEIVMEQEELSDSEEDIEEHVEFKCEEMADPEIVM